MQTDSNLVIILNKVKEQYKIKFGIDIEIETIKEVVDAQVETTKLGIVAQENVLWGGFVKFLFTSNDTIKEAMLVDLVQMGEDDNLLPEDLVKLKKLRVIQKYKEIESNIKASKAKMRKSNTLSAELLINHVPMSVLQLSPKAIKFTKAINNKYNK